MAIRCSVRLVGSLTLLGLAVAHPGTADPISAAAIPDPEVEAHLEHIDAPCRNVTFESGRILAGRHSGQRLEVYGSLKDADVLLLLAASGYHKSHVYRMIGDSQYALLMADCDCALQYQLVFRHDKDRWTFLYQKEAVV
jgi:hypothetical protein